MPHRAFPMVRHWASVSADAVMRFIRNTEAALTVEAVLILPFYLQFYISIYAFFDAFRMATVNEKAAYTISDVITRRNAGAPVDNAYITWLNDLFDYLLENRAATWIRVSSVTWADNGGNPRYEIEWSVATRGNTSLTTGTVQQLAPQLPIMPVGDTVILVETETRFGLGYNVPSGSPRFYMFAALGDQILDTFIFTRPRFAPRIEHTGS